MNIHKLLFPGKAKLIEEMDQKLMDSLEQIKTLTYHNEVTLGGLIYDIPFLPEDIGFETIEQYTHENGFLIVYHRDGWQMARTEDDFTKFVVIPPEKERKVLKLANLRDAIIVLEGIGMDINRDSIVEEDI